HLHLRSRHLGRRRAGLSGRLRRAAPHAHRLAVGPPAADPCRSRNAPRNDKNGAMTEASTNRRLAAILAADVVGYSRMMGADEAGTLTALKRHRETIFDPAVAAHNGRIVKLIGDGVIVEFSSVVDAVNCALSV